MTAQVPVTIKTVQVIGTFLKLDGSPQSGTVTFSAPGPVICAASNAELVGDINITLAPDGTLSALLLSTDDPALNPSGWTYTVTERLAGCPARAYALALPVATVGAVDLLAVSPPSASMGNAVPVPGPPGPAGPPGPTGPAGAGVPTGGSAGQVLKKNSASNNDTSWTTLQESDVANLTADLAARLPLAGGAMTGLLTLSGTPTAALHATTKGYTDTTFVPVAQRGSANGVATLDATGKIPSGQLPASTGGTAYVASGPSTYGWKEWNFPPEGCSTVGASLVAGTLHATMLVVQNSGTVSALNMYAIAAGASLTASQCYAALYDHATGSRLAVTGDISATLASLTNNLVTFTFTGSATLTAGQKVYACIVANGTTMPQFGRLSATTSVTPSNLGLTAAAGLRYSVMGTAQTSAPATITPTSAVTSGALPLWVALS